jgi:cytochrome b561
MAGSGLATAVISGVNQVVFGPSGGSLPASLLIYPTRVAHGYIGVALAVLIAVHVGAVLYHQLGRQDGLLGRMTFGQRT